MALKLLRWTPIPVFCLFLLATGMASGAERSGARDIGNLRRGAAVVIEGEEGYYGRMSARIIAAGDVNGDNLEDVVVSEVDDQGDLTRGRNWVLFGQKPMPDRIDLRSPDTYSGFVIEGADEGDRTFQATALGDMNGDGFDDLAIGGGGVYGNDSHSSGMIYVVFGKADTEPVDLALFDDGQQGDRGFRIKSTFGYLPGGVVASGDLNGDGRGEIFVQGGHTFTRPQVARDYLVFGKPDTEDIDLADFEGEGEGGNPPTQLGFRIETSDSQKRFGHSIGAAGDVNEDGLPDFVIGVAGCRGPEGHLTHYGCVVVVFGKTDTWPVDATEPGFAGGFRIEGFDFGGPTAEVSGAGDVNADGKDDIIVGDATEGCCGKAYVFFGKSGTDTLKTDDLKGQGYLIKGRARVDWLGGELAPAGDVNGDGKDDVFIGAPGSYGDSEDRNGKGAAYLIYGRKRSFTVPVGVPDSPSRELRGGLPGDFVGEWVGAMPDLSGDGIPELLIGSSNGLAYIVWG